MGAESQDLTLYSTAAQVIPVLFLALAFDVLRVRGDEVEHHWEPLYFTALSILALVAGEVTSIRVLAEGEANETQEGIVTLSLAVGGFTILGEVIFARVLTAPTVKDNPALTALGAGLYWLAVLVVGIVATFA